MERAIIVEVVPCSVSIRQKEKTHPMPHEFQRRLGGVSRGPKVSLRESAKRYKRSTFQRSSRGVATRATGMFDGGVAGENLHCYLET
jgi:hypothetical protein